MFARVTLICLCLLYLFIFFSQLVFLIKKWEEKYSSMVYFLPLGLNCLNKLY